LTRLQELNLNGTKVTDAGGTRLQKALPNCKIHHPSPQSGGPYLGPFTP